MRPERLTIAIQVEAFPGKSVPHRKPRQIRRPLSQFAFARLPLALDELDHTNPHAMAERTKGGADRSGRFSLAIAGIDQEQAFWVLGGVHVNPASL